MKNVLSKCLALSTDHPDHLILFRKYVSRKAACKGRAVLEGVGLDSETIAACFNSHPLNEEEAVQAGLIEWCGGQSKKPPTWQVLFAAMEYAQIAKQHVNDLKNEPGLFGTQCVTGVCLHVCMHTVQVSTSCTYVQWISKCVECNAKDSASNKLAMAMLFVKAAITFACVGHCKKINKWLLA